jgi:hypothetical protein
MEVQLGSAGDSAFLQGDAHARERSFAGVRIKLPIDWSDISADLPTGAIPTLAKLMGNGALQFRVWRRLPSFPEPFGNLDATSAVVAFANQFGLGEPSAMDSGLEASKFAVATYRRRDDVIRVWCFAAGHSMALLTYVGYALMQTSSEVGEADAIAMSLVFDDAP